MHDVTISARSVGAIEKIQTGKTTRFGIQSKFPPMIDKNKTFPSVVFSGDDYHPLDVGMIVCVVDEADNAVNVRVTAIGCVQLADVNHQWHGYETREAMMDDWVARGVHPDLPIWVIEFVLMTEDA